MAIVIHKYIILIIRYKSVLENGRTIHTCGSRTQRKNRRFFCLFARGGTNLKIDKDSRMGWANKQKRDARHKHLVKISRGEEVTPAELLQKLRRMKRFSILRSLCLKSSVFSPLIPAFFPPAVSGCSRFHGSSAIHSRRSHHPPESDAQHASRFCRDHPQTRAPVPEDVPLRPVRR